MTTPTDPAGPTNTAFPSLFSPLSIGSVTLKNRIFSSGHDTVMADHGRVSEQLVAYQEARAAGGVGLIVIQVGAVHATAEYTAHALALHDDSSIEGYARLAEAIHRHGCPVFAQIFHGGREIMDSLDGSLPVALAPSAVPTERFHVMPRAMPLSLIEEIVAGYAAAARRVQAAGLDGVEIVASHGYLPAQFLNPRLNVRTDRYGGSLENRLRFLRDVIAAVRAEVGRDFVVGLRISIVEMEPAGITQDESLEALRELDEDETLDYVSVGRRQFSDTRGIGPHRAADDDAERLHGAARRAREGRGTGSGAGRRPREPAPGGGADRRDRPGGRGGDDPGAHLRSTPARQGIDRPS